MAETYILNFEANTSKAVKSVDKLDDSIKDTSKNTGNLEGALGSLDSASGGLVSKFKGLKGGLKSVTAGFKSMRLAIISTGIGALVLGITALGAAFTGSEEGQNKFAKIMGVIGALTGNLVDLFADLGEKIISVFENPVESLKSFGDLIKDNLNTRFEGLINLVPSLGKAITQLFKGNFSKAGKIAADAVGKVTLGMDSVTDSVTKAATSIKTFTEEQIKEGKAAAEVADMRAKADKIERQLIIDRSKLESEIAQLRLKSRQEDQFSAAERKQALLDAQVLEDSLLDKETEFLELRRDAQIAENTFSRSNKENLTKEADAIAAVNRQQAARANTARQVQREVNTISKQIEAETKAAETSMANFKKTLRDAQAVEEVDKRALELEKLREHYASLREEAILNDLAVDELDIARDAAIAEKQATFDATDKARRDKKIADEIAAAEKIAAEKKAIQDKAFADAVALAGAESKLGKAIVIAKQLLLAKEMIMEMKATLFSAKQSATKTVMKGAEAGVDVSSGAAKTASSLPFPANIPLILGYAVQAAGIIKTIKSAMKSSKQATSKLGVSGSTVNIPDVSTTAGGQTAAQTPSFDILGTSGTNQLAAALGQQAPVQAFVVSQDVTSAQSLQNNIIQGASLG